MKAAAEVKAAGGVVWRAAKDGSKEYAVIHRPRYDDWSLPKGKLDAGEDFLEAAVREVLEEIGVTVEVGKEVEPTRYRDNKGREKIVRYWLMEATKIPPFKPNDEVDEVRWLSAKKALKLLTYKRDKELIPS